MTTKPSQYTHSPRYKQDGCWQQLSSLDQTRAAGAFSKYLPSDHLCWWEGGKHREPKRFHSVHILVLSVKGGGGANLVQAMSLQYFNSPRENPCVNPPNGKAAQKEWQGLVVSETTTHAHGLIAGLSENYIKELNIESRSLKWNIPICWVACAISRTTNSHHHSQAPAWTLNGVRWEQLMRFLLRSAFKPHPQYRQAFKLPGILNKGWAEPSLNII